MLYQISSALENFVNAHADTLVGQELKYILENGVLSERTYLIFMGVFIFTLICIDTYRISKEQKKNKKESIDEVK